MVKRIVGAGLIGIALLIGLGCREPEALGDEPAAVEPRRGGTVVIGTITDVDSWNEYLSQQSFSNYVLHRIFLRLAAEKGARAGRPEDYAPLLADSWEAGDEGTSILFRLRAATWSDGVPVTADDVRFTWQAQKQLPWISAETKDRITDVEVVDERTVIFRFNGPYPYQFADAVEGGILPRHVFGAIPFEDWPTHDWSQYSIGSGPFVLEDHAPGNEFVLVRNPRYFDAEHPRVDRVVVRVVPDVINLMTQLQAGDIDFLTGIPPRDAYRLSSDSRSRIEVLDFPIPRYEYLGWNCERPPFDDPMVRRALTMAIDREDLVEALIYEYGTVSSRPVPSAWWGAVDDVDPWPYDPEQARRILRERGFRTKAPDGTLDDTGRPLAFDLMTNAGNQLRSDALVKIQEQLSRIGVKVEIQVLEQKTLIQHAKRGDFDGYLSGWNFVGKVPLDILFGSRYFPPAGSNTVRYRSDRVDELLAQVDLAPGWQEMKRPLDEIQLAIHEDQPYTFLFERAGIAAHGPRLHGVSIDNPSDPLAGLESFWVASNARE